MKWSCHLPPRVEWGTKLEKVEERLGGGEAGITGLWGQSGGKEVKVRYGSRIFLKRERLTYG